MEKLAVGVVPEVGEYNIGKRSWHNMGRVTGEGVGLLCRSFQITMIRRYPNTLVWF